MAVTIGDVAVHDAVVHDTIIGEAIARIDAFDSEIAQALRATPITITPEVPRNVAARFNYKRACIQVNPEVAQADVVALASSLIHEGQHAKDHYDGRLSTNTDPLPLQVEDEVRAYTIGARFWSSYYPDGKYPEANEVDASENTWQKAYQSGTLRRDVVRLTISDYFKTLLDLLGQMR